MTTPLDEGVTNPYAAPYFTLRPLQRHPKAATVSTPSLRSTPRRRAGTAARAVVTNSAVQHAVRRLPWPPGRGMALLFHNVASEETSWTDGLGVTISPEHFTECLEYSLRHHHVVDLDGFLETGRRGRRRPLLITFDDAYASVSSVAAPICEDLGVPAVFFVNHRYVDNTAIALDNLVAHVVNTQGFRPILAAAGRHLTSVREVLADHVPSLSLSERNRFALRLAERAGVDPGALANAEKPYVTTDDLVDLERYGFEIGNHTATHVHCRVLEGDEIDREIAENKAALERTTRRHVRAFAFPYGNRADATGPVMDALDRTGHVAAFVVHGRQDGRGGDSRLRPRISLTGEGSDLFVQLEVLPRLRALKPQPKADGRGVAR